MDDSFPKGTTLIDVDGFSHRVTRFRRDIVGNDLTATLMWCDKHNEPVWVYGDQSWECPQTRIVEWDTKDHIITLPPWEAV
jgi:hypothetical protein